MLLRLALLFTVVPLIELVLLIQLSHWTTLETTIILVILTGVVGAALTRRAGWKTWERIQRQLREGTSPADELLSGLLILIAGALLVTPGLLTDLVGFSLLIAPLRNRLRRRLGRYFKDRMVIVQHPPGGGSGGYDIIDMPPD